MRIQSLTRTLSAAVLASVSGIAMAAGSCTNMANDGLTACNAQASADYGVRYAGCRNIENQSRRADCMLDATQTRDQAQDTDCPAVQAARLDACAALGDARYSPALDSADFLSPEAIAVNPNPYLPLVPGNQWAYAGTDYTVTVTVTSKTRRILGITAIAVRDVQTDGDGNVIEDTLDWYAQQSNGDVWYMGELSRNYVGGRLHDLEGSWLSGVDLARPGLILKGVPVMGDMQRLEFQMGVAEDVSEVTSLIGIAATPAANCDANCLVTRETDPLAPGIHEDKYYKPGTGLILTVDGQTGRREELTSFTRASP